MKKSKQERNKKIENKETHNMNDAINEIIANFDRLLKDEKFLKYIPSGSVELDKTLDGGFKKGELVLLVSRPGEKNTSFIFTCLLNVTLERFASCALFSSGMTKEQVVQHLLCSLAGVSIEKAIKGELSDKEWEKIDDATKTIEKTKIFVDDATDLLVEDIFKKCKKIKEEHELDFVVVGISIKQNDNSQVISKTACELKKMAQELDVAVLVLAQSVNN